jgi:DNA-binding winged helix-turn-helix (wHTH) protein/TolB-like protein/tetratricopeptide (TPR) repeat protein
VRSGERPTTLGPAQEGSGHLREPVVPLTFGLFRLDPGQRRLIRVTDEGEEPVALGSRALDLLMLLARRPGALISKNELMDAGWPGVAVEENNLSVQISSLRRALGDGQNGTRLIETVPGRGYRFLPDVTQCADPAPDRPTATPNAPPTATQARRLPIRSWQAAATFLLLAVLAGVFAAGRTGAPPKPDTRPALSIVVLPFTAGGPDRAYDYIADTITDDLTTRAAMIAGAFVIARGTASTFRGQTDSRSIAAQLGVRYLLEGSVRPLGPLIRVNASLVEADTGATIWSGQFDSGIVGLPAAQDDAVNRIAGALGSRLVDTEARRVEREHPGDADALDLILRARSILNLPQNPERNESATALLRKALERDPRSVGAMALLGDLLLTRWTLVRDRAGSEARTAEARSLLGRAAALDPRRFGVLVLRALLLRIDGAWEDAAIAYREALVMQPSWSAGYNQLALCALMLGYPEQALPLLEQALRLDPMAPDVQTRYALMGQALLVLGRNEEAVEWLRRAVQAFPPPQTLYRDLLAAALARAGRLDQAEEELRRALDRLPCMTVSWVRHRADPSSAPAFRNALADGLALAGLRNDAGVEGRVAAAPGRCDRTIRQAPGVARLTTDQLDRMVSREKPPVLLALFHADRAIPGTVWVSPAAIRPNASADAIETFRQQLEHLTGGDRQREIVVIPWNIETAGQQPLAALAASLGYSQVYSYPDGLEAWIARSLILETPGRHHGPQLSP